MGCGLSKNINSDTIQDFSLEGYTTKAYVCEVIDGNNIVCIFDYNNKRQKFNIKLSGYISCDLHPDKNLPIKERDIIIENAIKTKRFIEFYILNKWIYLECGKFDNGKILGIIKLNKDDKKTFNKIIMENNKVK